ncbi:hypothetical protein [Micromonospora sp. WMMD812]|uniref:hypothetical protein n=1 Tax=Micromonospora sp. WMMD812 TaxID=3015152 RepID=UPI00248C1F28|nr:hypothetical protein [Micromonospora sp. WMMD812]WBB66128.1 hypothetical protein O7603_23580 [Micromonospora sp. WMMD812]
MTAINQNRPPTSTTEHARQQASRVGQQTAQAGGQVGHVVAEQGRQVAAQAGQQARHLGGEATSQLREQARSQQHHAAERLRGLGRDLDSMADRGDSGMAGEAVRRAADAAQRTAGWIDNREPADMLHEVRGYARQHPGIFLAGAAVAGLLVGRLTRNLASSGDGQRSAAQTGQTGQMGQAGQPMQAGPQPGERGVQAPYTAEGPYAGTARAQNVSPANRQDPDVPGGVAP